MRYKAMTYFAIDTLKINNQMESLSGIYRELLNEAREIQQLALNLDSDMKKHRDDPFVSVPLFFRWYKQGDRYKRSVPLYTGNEGIVE